MGVISLSAAHSTIALRDDFGLAEQAPNYPLLIRAAFVRPFCV